MEQSSTKRKIGRVVMATCFSFCVFQGIGQTVETIVDRQSILIGERIKYTVKGNFPQEGGNTISWFKVPDSVAHFDILDKGQLEQVSYKDGSRGYEQTILFTSFDSGRWNLPSFVVRTVAEKQQQPMTFYTDSVAIDVGYSPADSSGNLRDIKPIREVSMADYFWYYIAGGLLLLLLIAYLVWRYLKKRPKKPVPEIQSKLSPYEEAMQELKILESDPLQDNAGVKHYHTRLTDILKRYLGRIEHKSLVNKTTGDLLIHLSDQNMGPGELSNLATALRTNDAVKFAKYKPPVTESNQSLLIIKETIMAIEKGLTPKPV